MGDKRGLMTVVFDAAALEAWKRQLREVVSGGAVEQTRVLSCLDSLDHLGRLVTDPPVVSTLTDGSAPAQVASAPSTRRSVGTQLWTVRPIHYTHYVLNKVRRERQCKALARRLGDVAASMYAVAHDLCRVLHASAAKAPSQNSPLFSGAGAATTGPSASPAHHAAPALSTATRTTLQSLFGATILSPAAAALLSPLGQRDQVLGADARAASGLVAPSSPRVDAQTQTSADLLDGAASVSTSQQRHPFLCRRCRQDGRTGYEVDMGKMQLTHTNNDAVAVRRAAAPRRTPSACADTRRVIAHSVRPLPSSSPPRADGARPPQARLLPRL